jgi:hypothetical protein
MMTRGELKGKILRVLNRSGATVGFYTDDKVNDAIEECLDYVAAEMFLADEGWQTKLQTMTIAAGQISLDIPMHMAMIKEVRFTAGGLEYVPLTYNDGSGMTSAVEGSGATQFSGCYRIIDNAFYFDPPLGSAGTLQVEYMAFPSRLQDDGDFIEGQFGPAMTHFIKYRAASQLAASFGKANPDWARFEGDWYEKMLLIVNKRNMQTTTIREFEG